MKHKPSQPSTFKVPSNPGPHKNQKRLDSRILDWENLPSSKKNGGYHKPGSYNK